MRLSLILAALTLLTACSTSNITHEITVQPIQFSNDDGTETANEKKELLFASTQKIMAQAGIRVKFLPFKTFKSTKINQGVFDGKAPVEQFLNKAPLHTDKSVINLFFVKLIDPKKRIGGIGKTPGRIFLIAEWSLKKNVQHVIAHELCHNLGLGHTSYDAAIIKEKKAARNLMHGQEPFTIKDVFPDGKKCSQLNKKQIERIFKSPAVKLLK